MAATSLASRLRTTLGLVRSLVVYWRPGRQRSLRRLYQPFVRPGDLVFDIGAHLGDRTAAFAALGARVVALEPQPALRHWLNRLVGCNSSVTISTQAVGAQSGTELLAVSDATPAVSSMAAQWRQRIGTDNRTFRRVRWERAVPVTVTTLDALIAQHGLPAFCKIDVEGFEAEVLDGLSQAIPGVSVEFVAGAIDVARDCIARLRGLGNYEFNAIRGEGREFAFKHWQTAPAIIAWLQAGAGGASSGDVYARLTHR